jgi:hypothetical protein
MSEEIEAIYVGEVPMWVMYVVVWAVVFGCFGWYVAAQGRRDWLEGFFLGAIFGPFGVIVTALLLLNPHTPIQLDEDVQDEDVQADD